MRKLSTLIDFISGSAQFRISESLDAYAPVYHYYTQTCMSDDLVDMVSAEEEIKEVRTFDDVNTVQEGDILFSLISGTATIVRAVHQNAIFSQNYVKLVPSKGLDRKYLVYILNEDTQIRKQLFLSLQGSMVLKYTLNQLKDLTISKLPSIQRQEAIGKIYFMQLRLEALHNRAASLEKALILKKLEEVITDE